MTAVQLLTIPKVMERLDIKSKDTVYRLISTGELRAVDVSTPPMPGRPARSKTRVREDDLADFIDKRTRTAGIGQAS